ncbi:MAG: hypothetical protein PVG25_02335 [Anaerolineae bacterium]|jgi:ABC-type glycerol-3-phosphate transport system substrate-binding protein
MKRWMPFLLAVLLLATIAPACAPTSTPSEVVVEEEQAKPIEEVVQPTEEIPQEVISFWTWASTPFEQEAVEKMVRQFSANTGIDVDLLVR